MTNPVFQTSGKITVGSNLFIILLIGITNISTNSLVYDVDVGSIEDLFFT